MSMKNSGRLFILILSLLAAIHPAMAIAQGKPNIVLVFLDNFGWGEPGFNGGGIIRGMSVVR